MQVWGGQFGTLLTRNTLYRDTANCLIHPAADRPLTAREAARVQVGGQPGCLLGEAAGASTREKGRPLWAAWMQ